MKDIKNISTESLVERKRQLEIILKPEESTEYIRIPVDTGNHEGHRIRTIDISEKEGIKAIYCGTDKVVMTYLFAKDHDWTMEKARAWVKEHGKSVIVSVTTNSVNDDEIITAHIQTDNVILSSPRAAQISQEEIIDEFDYLNTLIVIDGISDKAKPAMWTLVKEILRLAGDDIPVDIIDFLKLRPIVEVVKKETLTYQDIQEAIKRIASK